MILNYVGYHGTSEEKGNQILKCGYFKWSDGEDEWLGSGIYFFERSGYYAIWWASDIKHFVNYRILKADITLESEKILDLTVPSNTDELDYYANMLMQKKAKTKSFAHKEINDNLVINYIYNNIQKFDAVIGIFDQTRYKRKALYKSRILPHQIQVCIRNTPCITNIQEA